MKERLDVVLTRMGLAKSRTSAQEMIKEGSVSVNGSIISKASEMIDFDSDKISVSDSSLVEKYVGRGGFKLETAINEYGIELNGRICLDIGASTGGFTDCMLKNGAKKVFAVDVGTNQLAESLRKDDRVISLEKLDIRKADKEIYEKVDFISIDVSFISLKCVLPELKRFSSENAYCVALIKPQFENGKVKNGKKGVIKDPKVHKRIVEDMCLFGTGLGFSDIKTVPSAILGGDGNKEFLMYFKI